MKKFKLTIGNKILMGFMGLIIIFVSYVIFSVYINNKNNQKINESSNITKPSADLMKDFKHMIVRSQMLITNWVYLPKNNEDKQQLENLHDYDYPELKDELSSLMKVWHDKQSKKKVDSIFTQFEALLKVQQEQIMSQLKTFDDYEDPMIKFMADGVIEDEIVPKSNVIINQLEEVIQNKNQEAKTIEADVIQYSNQLKSMTIFLGIFISIVGLALAYYMARSITKPINYLKNIIRKLANGELPDQGQKKFAKDEIGQMAEAVNKLVAGLRSTSLFAEKIGNGNYKSEYQPLSKHDVLGNALIEMRNNLKKVSEEDKRRNWATEGLAKFGEILRKNNDNIEKLSDEIISNLIRYLEANQGGLYILNNNEGEEPYLNLSACYAWDKKKYLEQKILEGEGLTGQCWSEKDTIYLTEIPQGYIMITSGLGEALPNSLLIVPLKVNDEVYGVIEIASFNEFSEYEIEFIEKIAESIASTISSVKINQTTQKLLEESTELTEQMRAQEEEMRQNMEELQATQEEMQRANREREAKERIVENTNLLFELDEEFKIVNINNMVNTLLRYDLNEVKGQPFHNLLDNKLNMEMMAQKIGDGNTWSGTLQINSKYGDKTMVKVAAGRIPDIMNNKNKYLLFASDISNVAV